MTRASTNKAEPPRQSIRSAMRIFIVDDHELMRDGLSQLIDHEDDLEVCGEATGEDDALSKLDDAQPDLAIIDISLRQGNGIELIKRIKARTPTIRTIVSSMHDESLYAERALRAGALGYVSKQAPARSIIDAIRRVLAGELYLSDKLAQRIMRRAVVAGSDPNRSPIDTLSDRELEVFELIGMGLTTSDLAKRLHLSAHTIETYRQRLKTKLSLSSSTALAREAVQWVLERQ